MGRIHVTDGVLLAGTRCQLANESSGTFVCNSEDVNVLPILKLSV
jgi:hypothetical protein